jgi:hypothetical protein
MLLGEGVQELSLAANAQSVQISLSMTALL